MSRSVQPNGSVAVQISVDHEGWYSVPLSAMATLGLDTTRPAKLHMSAEGAEQAVEIKSGALQFYGLGLDTSATATRVYVVYKGTTRGTRIKLQDGSGDGPPTGDSFTDSVIRQDHTVYFASLLNGEASNFFGPLVSTVPLSQTIDVPKVSGSEGAQVEVSVQGVTMGHHSIQVDLNGVALGLLSFDGQQLGEATFAAPRLAEGSNEVTLTSGSAGDYGLVGAISVTYSRSYVATGDVLRFTVGGGTRVSVSGFSDPGVRMVDVTNSAAPVEVTPQVSLQGETYMAAAKIPGAGTRTVYAFAPAQVQVAAAAADIPSSLRSPANAADLVIITTADLAPSLAPLTALREQQGLKVSVVDVQDVYDEFSFSEKDPSAIQAFLSYARGTWTTPPSYVLMFGDGTYDPRGWLGGSADLIPIKLVDTTFMETASDTWFVDADSDGMADLPVGRIPVDDPSSAAAVVAKLVAYDASSAPASVVLAADQADGYDFPGGMDQLAGSVPEGVGVTSLVRPNGGNAELLAAVDAGPTVADYLGHGNVDSWAGAWLSSVDAPDLSNASHPALFVSMTCLNAYFADPSLPSLGEALLDAPGGAVAVWGSTGLGDPASELALNQALFGELFDAAAPGGLAPVRLGDALLAAQRAAPNAGLLATGVLLGDPTMVLR
jgi:hypothetical protein